MPNMAAAVFGLKGGSKSTAAALSVDGNTDTVHPIIAHDGYTDQLYALLPVWQGEFGLSYAGLALVRALYYAPMAGLQVPADKLTAKLSPRNALVLATLIAAAGYFVVALPLGFRGLGIGLIVAGIG